MTKGALYMRDMAPEAPSDAVRVYADGLTLRRRERAPGARSRSEASFCACTVPSSRHRGLTDNADCATHCGRANRTTHKPLVRCSRCSPPSPRGGEDGPLAEHQGLRDLVPADARLDIGDDGGNDGRADTPQSARRVWCAAAPSPHRFSLARAAPTHAFSAENHLLLTECLFLFISLARSPD